MAAKVKKRKKIAGHPVGHAGQPPGGGARTGIGVLLEKSPPPLFQLWCLRLSLRS